MLNMDPSQKAIYNLKMNGTSPLQENVNEANKWINKFERVELNLMRRRILLFCSILCQFWEGFMNFSKDFRYQF